MVEYAAPTASSVDWNSSFDVDILGGYAPCRLLKGAGVLVDNIQSVEEPAGVTGFPSRWYYNCADVA